MTNINSRPSRCGRIALIALLFSIFCGFARAGDSAPFAGNAVPASNAAAGSDIYFRLHAEAHAAATPIALPGREMTDGAALRPVNDCTGRVTAAVLQKTGAVLDEVGVNRYS
jgi:hypothetical protein